MHDQSMNGSGDARAGERISARATLACGIQAEITA
jgi:hypothetical protein